MKKIFKLLAQAQSCSDAGKGYKSTAHNGINAVVAGYNLKDFYILQALSLAKKINNKNIVMFNIEYDDDLDMTIVLFNTAFGQISFHSFLKESKLIKFKKFHSNIYWNGKTGQSIKTARRIEKYYNFQSY